MSHAAGLESSGEGESDKKRILVSGSQRVWVGVQSLQTWPQEAPAGPRGPRAGGWAESSSPANPGKRKQSLSQSFSGQKHHPDRLGEIIFLKECSLLKESWVPAQS